MKKILIVSCVFYPEPVVSARLSNDIAELLTLKGNKVTVICPAPSRPLNSRFTEDDCSKQFEFKVVRTKSYLSPVYSLIGRVRESISFGLSVSKFIKENSDFDLAYVNSWPLFSQFIIGKQLKQFKIPMFIHIQDLYPESLTTRLNQFIRFPFISLYFVENKIASFARKIILVSDGMRAQYLKTRKVDSAKLYVIHNWQDEKDYLNHGTIDQEVVNVPSNKDRKLRIGYLGNIGPITGLENIVRFFKRVTNSNLHLVIGGGGSKKEECFRIIKELDITNVSIESVPFKQSNEFLQSCDICLLPLKKGHGVSSVPSKLPGYQFAKKPVLGFLDESSDTANAIIASKGGWVVPAENFQLLEEELKQISTMNQSEFFDFGVNSFNYAIDNFSKRINSEKLVNLLLNEI